MPLLRVCRIACSVVFVGASVFAHLLAAQSSHADDSLLTARRLVWTAFFTNDQHALGNLLPEDLVAGNKDSPWKSRNAILQDAANFAAHNGKLLTLNFTHVHIQHFREVTVIYSDYSLTGEWSGAPFQQKGKTTEVFVRRNQRWINTGWQIDETP